MRIVVVGGGRQGVVIASNLLSRPERPEIAIADIKEPVGLPKGAKFHTANVLDEAQARALCKGSDAVVLAVPSEIAHDALKNLLLSGVPVADVSFTPDPPLSLDPIAKGSGACCVVDCGVAPGLSHILIGGAHKELGGLDEVRILVGGMPQKPPSVFEHAVYFNPHDLIAEYIRPARARVGGEEIAPNPIDAPIEAFKDEELGDLELFISDGLRSLLTSYPTVPTMRELTIRWKGHLKSMRDMRELGLFDSPEVIREVGNALAHKFSADAYPDVLLMIVEAVKGKERRTWRLIDRRTNEQSAMSRTTGFTTAATAMVLARKQFTKPGVHAPEQLGQHGLARAIVEDLQKFGINVTEPVAMAG